MKWLLFFYIAGTHQIVYYDAHTLYNSEKLCEIDAASHELVPEVYTRCRPVTLPKEWKLR